jgi:tetratricopeptide (TPR) repeat protein
VSVVASYRSDDLHRRHPLRAAAAAWGRMPSVSRVHLGRLDDDAVRRLVRSLHPGPLREGALHAIVERSEGNAFFVEELVGAAELDRSRVPDDLADLLLLRLDRLDDEAHRVVRAASAAGRWVSHALLSCVVDLDRAGLDRAVRSAVEAHVLVPTEGSGYAFRHALLAEAVYDDLLPGERVRLHGAYVDALSSGAVDATAAELARHARAARDLPTAVRASIRAGDDAMSVGGPGEAAQHYQQALALLAEPGLDVGDPGDYVDLVVRTADAVTAAGKPHRALALVQEQLARLPEGSTGEPRVRLLLALASAALFVDSTVNALSVTTEALSLIDPEPSMLRARLLALHAEALMDRQRYEETSRWAVEALELGTQLRHMAVITQVTTTLAKLEQRVGDASASREPLERVVSEARANGQVAEELRGLYTLGSLHFEAGDFAAAAKHFATASRRAAETGRPWAPYGFDARLMEALTAYVQGRWDRVLEIVDVTGQQPPGLPEAELRSAGLGVSAGRGDTTALALLDQLRPWWDRDGFLPIMGAMAAIDLHGDAGDLEAALAVHDEGVDGAAAIMESPYFLGRIRMSALMLGQLSARATRTPASARAPLVERGARLAADARAALEQSERKGRHVGPEARAWVCRLDAELLRLHWLTDTEPPQEETLVDGVGAGGHGVRESGHRFEHARSQARLAAVLRPSAGPPRPGAGAGGDGDRPRAEGRAAIDRAEGGRRAALGRVRRRRTATSDGQGAGGAPAGRRGPLQQRDRPPPVHQRQDGERSTCPTSWRSSAPAVARRRQPWRGSAVCWRADGAQRGPPHEPAAGGGSELGGQRLAAVGNQADRDRRCGAGPPRPPKGDPAPAPMPLLARRTRAADSSATGNQRLRPSPSGRSMPSRRSSATTSRRRRATRSWRAGRRRSRRDRSAGPAAPAAVAGWSTPGPDSDARRSGPPATQAHPRRQAAGPGRATWRSRARARPAPAVRPRASPARPRQRPPAESFSTTTTSRPRRTSARAVTRADVIDAPVGFCARGWQKNMRAPASTARRSDPGTGPASSTSTPTTCAPATSSRSSSGGKHGFSTATRSP